MQTINIFPIGCNDEKIALAQQYVDIAGRILDSVSCCEITNN